MNRAENYFNAVNLSFLLAFVYKNGRSLWTVLLDLTFKLLIWILQLWTIVKRQWFRMEAFFD
jgi:hypothetical protein